MNKTTHTPGPWNVMRDPLNPNPRVIAGSKIVTVVSQGAAFAKETDANAALIAAAPDLLQALRKLVDEVASVDVLDPLDLPRRIGLLIPQARAAITRAEGKS